MKLFNISDGKNLSIDLLDYGARIAGITYQGKSMACAFQKAEDYLNDPFYLGATIGPIGNRIANAQLDICGTLFNMPANEGKHCLHSGDKGFDKYQWSLKSSSKDSVELELVFDLSNVGLKGELITTARYSVFNGALTIDYICQSDTTTYINLTNHVYLNLSGRNQNISDHEFEFYAQSFVEVDEQKIPTGNTPSLNSPFRDITRLTDHHFNVGTEEKVKPMAKIRSNISGIELLVSSTSPGFQFYNGEFLSTPFVSSEGFCIETQLAPNAINQPTFYAPLLNANELRQQRTIFQFAT